MLLQRYILLKNILKLMWMSISASELQKALTIALKELGFKSSKVTKIINAGRFLQAYDWFEEARCYFGLNSNDRTGLR